jgi:hypothetical protein
MPTHYKRRKRKTTFKRSGSSVECADLTGFSQSGALDNLSGLVAHILPMSREVILYKVTNCDFSKDWKLGVNEESRACLCWPEVSFTEKKSGL